MILVVILSFIRFVLSDCSTVSDPTSLSKTLYVSATETQTYQLCTSETYPCKTISAALSKASTSGWNKIILRGSAGTTHSRDTTEISIGTNQVWITAQSADVVFIPSGLRSGTIQHDVFDPLGNFVSPSSMSGLITTCPVHGHLYSEQMLVIFRWTACLSVEKTTQ